MNGRETVISWIKDALTALDCADDFVRHGKIDDRPDLVIRLDKAKIELEDIYSELKKGVQ